MTSPTLAFEFAIDKSLVDKVSGQNLITFTRNTSATFFDANGTLQTAAANVARFTHNPVTLKSLGLLIEGAATNLLLNSASLSTQNVTVTAVAHTLSFTGTGTVTLSGASTAGPLVGTGSGWGNRVALTFTPTAGTLTLTVSGTVEFAQLETGPRDTSYISTTGSQVTRNADNPIISGVNFTAGWHNASAGSLFCQGRSQGARGTGFPTLWRIDDSTSDNRWFDYINSSNELHNLQIINSGTLSVIAAGTYIPGSVFRTVSAAIDNSFAYASNVSPSVTTSTARIMPVGVNRILIGQGVGSLFGTLSRLYYYPAKLSDSVISDYAISGPQVFGTVPEILRPSSDITQTSYTGGFAEINEVTRDDANYAYGAVNSAAPELVVGFPAPSVTPVGPCNVRWTHAKANVSGTILSTGSALNYTCALLEGSTVIASQTVSPGGWDQSLFTFDASDISDWSNLRLRWTQTASGGGGGNTRGGAVSWAEVEVFAEPPPTVTRYILIT
jgi:hypothetical protein